MNLEKTVLEACQLMSQAGVGSVLVSNGDKVVGILTERDVVRRVVSAKLDPSVVRLGEVMSTPIITISSEATVVGAARAMIGNRIRRLPVVQEGKLVGLITSDDLARYLSAQSDYNDELLNAIARYSKPPGMGPYV